MKIESPKNARSHNKIGQGIVYCKSCKLGYLIDSSFCHHCNKKLTSSKIKPLELSCKIVSTTKSGYIFSAVLNHKNNLFSLTTILTSVSETKSVKVGDKCKIVLRKNTLQNKNLPITYMLKFKVII